MFQRVYEYLKQQPDGADPEELLSLAPDQRRAGFYSCWARKEAYIKATGLGVSQGRAQMQCRRHVQAIQAPAALARSICKGPAEPPLLACTWS